MVLLDLKLEIALHDEFCRSFLRFLRLWAFSCVSFLVSGSPWAFFGEGDQGNGLGK